MKATTTLKLVTLCSVFLLIKGELVCQDNTPNPNAPPEGSAPALKSKSCPESSNRCLRRESQFLVSGLPEPIPVTGAFCATEELCSQACPLSPCTQVCCKTDNCNGRSAAEIISSGEATHGGNDENAGGHATAIRFNVALVVFLSFSTLTTLIGLK